MVSRFPDESAQLAAEASRGIDEIIWGQPSLEVLGYGNGYGDGYGYGDGSGYGSGYGYGYGDGYGYGSGYGAQDIVAA